MAGLNENRLKFRAFFPSENTNFKDILRKKYCMKAISPERGWTTVSAGTVTMLPAKFHVENHFHTSWFVAGRIMSTPTTVLVLVLLAGILCALAVDD